MADLLIYAQVFFVVKVSEKTGALEVNYKDPGNMYTGNQTRSTRFGVTSANE